MSSQKDIPVYPIPRTMNPAVTAWRASKQKLDAFIAAHPQLMTQLAALRKEEAEAAEALKDAIKPLLPEGIKTGLFMPLGATVTQCEAETVDVGRLFTDVPNFAVAHPGAVKVDPKELDQLIGSGAVPEIAKLSRGKVKIHRLAKLPE